LVLHPHVHGLVTGGGLTPAGQWVAVRNGFLLPARVIMAVFRGKMVDALRQAWAHGDLTLPEPLRPQQVVNLLHRLSHAKKAPWDVRIMERYRHGAVPSSTPAWWPTRVTASPCSIAPAMRRQTEGAPPCSA
jgi:hypothetical protein